MEQHFDLVTQVREVFQSVEPRNGVISAKKLLQVMYHSGEKQSNFTQKDFERTQFPISAHPSELLFSSRICVVMIIRHPMKH